MLIEFFQRNRLFRWIIGGLGAYKAALLLRGIESYLTASETVLDIGAGTCNMCALLAEKQYYVTPLDVRNLSFVDGIKPVIYNGHSMPFRDKQFDVALLIHVLHHTPDPERVVTEAKRVARKLIVMEDIYTGRFHKYLTYFADSLLNLEFFRHPHTNQDDAGWREAFGRLGLSVKGATYSWFFVIFHHAVYYLESGE